MLNSFGNDGAITSMSTPQAFDMPMDSKAGSQASEYPIPGHMLEASDAVGIVGGELYVQLAMMHDLGGVEVKHLYDK
jgi:hypothetical protein